MIYSWFQHEVLEIFLQFSEVLAKLEFSKFDKPEQDCIAVTIFDYKTRFWGSVQVSSCQKISSNPERKPAWLTSKPQSPEEARTNLNLDGNTKIFLMTFGSFDEKMYCIKSRPVESRPFSPGLQEMCKSKFCQHRILILQTSWQRQDSWVLELPFLSKWVRRWVMSKIVFTEWLIIELWVKFCNTFLYFVSLKLTFLLQKRLNFALKWQ